MGDLKNEKFRITIVGTGLLGCSFADGLRDIALDITGVDTNAMHLQEALYRGWIDKSSSLEKSVNSSDLVIISVPVDATVNILPDVLDNLGPATIVIDTGSVKGTICDSVGGHDNRDMFIAAHPMAGLALSGPESADARLFNGRKVVICEKDKSSGEALGMASAVFKRLGMDIIYMEPGLHDLIVAHISHLPQVIAYCLSSLTGGVDTDKELMFDIASSGYESSTRLSSSPAEMWVPIFRQNREFITASLDEMIEQLKRTREMIGEGNWAELEKIIGKANKSREQFLSAYKQS